MVDLCNNCGYPLPNAVGVGIYCNNCGEPVKHHTTPITTDTGLAVAGDALELLDAALELCQTLMDDVLDEYRLIDDRRLDEYRTIDSRRDAIVKRYEALRGPR